MAHSICPAQATANGEGSKAVEVPELARASVEARQCGYAVGSIDERPWAKAERKGLPGKEVRVNYCALAYGSASALLLICALCPKVFMSTDGAMYAFKGLAGRLGPIGVHASMLGILAGVAWGGVAGYKGSIMAPQGGEFITASALRPASAFAQPPQGPRPVLVHHHVPLVPAHPSIATRRAC